MGKALCSGEWQSDLYDELLRTRTDVLETCTEFQASTGCSGWHLRITDRPAPSTHTLDHSMQLPLQIYLYCTYKLNHTKTAEMVSHYAGNPLAITLEAESFLRSSSITREVMIPSERFILKRNRQSITLNIQLLDPYFLTL
jgi:hypothetical protein